MTSLRACCRYWIFQWTFALSSQESRKGGSFLSIFPYILNTGQQRKTCKLDCTRCTANISIACTCSEAKLSWLQRSWCSYQTSHAKQPSTMKYDLFQTLISQKHGTSILWILKPNNRCRRTHDTIQPGTLAQNLWFFMASLYRQAGRRQSIKLAYGRDM